MKTFNQTAAQGEIHIKKINSIPHGALPVKAENGLYIIGHSETGHCHVMTMERAQVFEAAVSPAGMRVLYAILDEPKELVHQRPHDTHETIVHAPGMYEFRLGREYDHYADLARKQAD